MTIEQILEAIEQMKVTELNELVKAAEEKFGVSASAPVMMAGAVAGGAAEEKTEFDVVLANAGASKVGVIKAVREVTACGECENDACAAQLRKELTRLVEFLGPQLFESRVTLAYQQEDAPYHVQELSRREMFSHMTEGSRAGTKKLLQMLPGLRSEEDSAADFRLMLHQRTKQLKAASETPLRYGWYLPNFTQKCFGCGKCEKACRSGALKLEDLPDGQTRVVVTPWKCSECGVCVAACSNSGIDGMKLRQLTTLGPVSVYKCSKTLCADCGKPIAPNSAEGICSVCRIKRRTKQRQEEAAARAKERIAEREARKAAEEAAKAAAAELAAENAAAAEAAAPAVAAPAAVAETTVAAPETAALAKKD